MLLRIGVWVKNSWDFFRYFVLQLYICRLTYHIPQNERTRFGYITHYFNIKQKLLSNEYFSTPTTSIDCRLASESTG